MFENFGICHVEYFGLQTIFIFLVFVFVFVFVVIAVVSIQNFWTPRRIVSGLALQLLPSLPPLLQETLTFPLLPQLTLPSSSGGILVVVSPGGRRSGSVPKRVDGFKAVRFQGDLSSGWQERAGTLGLQWVWISIRFSSVGVVVAIVAVAAVAAVDVAAIRVFETEIETVVLVLITEIRPGWGCHGWRFVSSSSGRSVEDVLSLTIRAVGDGRS
mmetsp:Transcript_26231/g.55660  ORF Transcript_26231/g.55660 Transcript_26231/m.55660 type:complete len:214 (+) Transcript_26231:1191-1832(+)